MTARIGHDGLDRLYGRIGSFGLIKDIEYLPGIAAQYRFDQRRSQPVQIGVGEIAELPLLRADKARENSFRNRDPDGEHEQDHDHRHLHGDRQMHREGAQLSHATFRISAMFAATVSNRLAGSSANASSRSALSNCWPSSSSWAVRSACRSRSRFSVPLSVSGPAIGGKPNQGDGRTTRVALVNAGSTCCSTS